MDKAGDIEIYLSEVAEIEKFINLLLHRFSPSTFLSPYQNRK